MKIGIDISPLSDTRVLGHQIRGTGAYIQQLMDSLVEYFPENEYIFFERGKSLPKDIDLIHYPYFEPFFLTLPFLKKHKTVVTVHDLTPFVLEDDFLRGTKGDIKWLIQKKLLQQSDAVITDSYASKQDIEKHGRIKNNNIHVVYLAAADEFIVVKNEVREKIRKKYNLPKKFALYVGDATPNKNLQRLLNAVLKTSIPLVLVGKALSEKEIDRTNFWNKDLLYAQYLIEENKQLMSLGYVPQQDLVSLYNAATVFVMPSVYEGFGLPVLESMSCGTPVICSRGGSLQEVGRGAAYFVDEHSEESIKKGIEEVFSNELLQKSLSKKGILQAKKFSWKKTTAETVAIYKNIVNV